VLKLKSGLSWSWSWSWAAKSPQKNPQKLGAICHLPEETHTRRLNKQDWQLKLTAAQGTGQLELASFVYQAHTQQQHTEAGISF
jgi:hypothetical protein